MLLKTAAIILSIVFALLCLYHLLLIMGFPFAQASWGGKHKVLPPKFRWGSGLAILILALAALHFLQMADVLVPLYTIRGETIIAWVFTAYTALNTLGNLNSKSRYEKLIMTPVSMLAFAVCLIVVLLA